MFQYANLGFLVAQMCKAYHDRQETFTTWLLATAVRLQFAVPCHGQPTMGSLEAIARVVTARLPPSEIPVDIFDSLRDVVWLRKEANAVFCQATDQQDDGEARRRSDGHLHAIHVFERILAVFDALIPPCAQWEAAARWEASRAGVAATLHDFLRRHAEAVAAMTSLQMAEMMGGGDWGHNHDNDVRLRRDSGISMTMTIEEDVPAEYFEYQVQGQYHMPLENQAWSCPPADNYYSGNAHRTAPDSTSLDQYREANSPNEAYRIFLESRRQTHSPDVPVDDKEAIPEDNGNIIIINHSSQAAAWPAQGPNNITPLIVHSGPWKY